MDAEGLGCYSLVSPGIAQGLHQNPLFPFEEHFFISHALKSGCSLFCHISPLIQLGCATVATVLVSVAALGVVVSGIAFGSTPPDGSVLRLNLRPQRRHFSSAR